MIQRNATGRLLEALSFFPISGIIGPRQVGKTTLAIRCTGSGTAYKNYVIRASMRFCIQLILVTWSTKVE